METDKNKRILFQDKREALKTFREGEIKSVTTEGKSLRITRFQDNFFVFESQCPHAGFDLSEAGLSPAGILVCPLHQFGFRLASGEELQRRCRPLKVVRAYNDTDGKICFDLWL